jgi:spore coat polysaccharide biosynthesis protein SpsF
MKTVAIIQARVGSTRLPGKVLMDVAGESMLARVVNRTGRAKELDAVVIATTTQPADDAIVRLCHEQGWPFFRGSEEDVLDRYYQAALVYEADVVIRITSDCPLIDSGVIDKVVEEFLLRYPDVDYASNGIQRTYPRGLDVEVMRFDALGRAWQEDHNAASREHVTPFIWRQPEKFTIRNIANDNDYSYMRWTVDTPEDLAFVRRVYCHFKKNTFSWREVLELLEEHPEWLEINRDVQQKAIP